MTFLSFTVFHAAAQRDLSAIDDNKYRINLPDYWARGNKVWQILDEKLPDICPEIKDKELCGDNCNPKYILDFYITEPIVYDYSFQNKVSPVNTKMRRAVSTFPLQQGSYPVYYSTPPTPINNWNIEATYGFQCFLLLRNDSGRVVTKLVLVDTNEVWQLSKRIDPERTATYGEPTPDTYIANHPEKLNPTIYEMLAIVDKKILLLK